MLRDKFRFSLGTHYLYGIVVNEGGFIILWVLWYGVAMLTAAGNLWCSFKVARLLIDNTRIVTTIFATLFCYTGKFTLATRQYIILCQHTSDFYLFILLIIYLFILI